MESHYCRADISRKYLEPGLSVIKTQELYKEKCDEEHLTPISSQTYRKIFATEYNLGFHYPGKD